MLCEITALEADYHQLEILVNGGTLPAPVDSNNLSRFKFLLPQAMNDQVIKAKGKRVLEEEMQFELEESGLHVRFLHADLHIVRDRLVIGPHLPNIDYARDVLREPPVSRCPVFLCPHGAPWRMLAGYLGPLVHNAAALVAPGGGKAELRALAAGALEARRRGWSDRHIAQALLSATRGRPGAVFEAAATMAVLVRQGHATKKTQSLR